ncbi:trimethyllysine dioxygenase, mitochondrial [Pieris rapae]|uniref:trimethyllysine dioxygenase, mitochondrial n=1 Tax=Pieris rapae TaxID=64459 RepID=UPI001E281612|nr:trimethyllysine dioxygenase, mitochondrial [Pieris rapae]
MTEIKAVNRNGTALKVIFDDGYDLTFESCWLRDHCRCHICYDPKTNLRTAHILDIPEVDIDGAVCKDRKLIVKWSDGHVSSYEGDFLSEFNYETWSKSRKSAPKLWRGDDIVNKVAKVPVKKFLNTTDGASAVFQSLLDYGVAFIEDVEPSLAATEVVCKALGGVQHTLFGGMWEISPEPGNNDTAYMSVGLPQHTDLSSFTEPAGLQVFHCLRHDGSGGASVISDGFYAAMKLKEENPKDFAFLTTFKAEADYQFDGHYFRHAAPMIELDQYNDVRLVRFNTHDRSSMAFESGEQCKNYYRAIRNFAKHIENKENLWTFKLKPGLIMVFDNFRAFHGRTEFTGMRVIVGSYVSRTDWLDKARSFKLIK